MYFEIHVFIAQILYNVVIRKVNYFWFEPLTLKQHCRIMGFFFLFIILFCYRGPPAVRECNSLQHSCHKYKSLFDSPPIDSSLHKQRNVHKA